jgi:tartrate/fumarate subfamily iron-sulfur-dependent hydro-lyase beta chain
MRLVLPAEKAALAELTAGQHVEVSGRIFTMRDAGHVRALAALREQGALPYGLAGQALFYAGPTEYRPDAERPFAAIGPTTASRMDFAAPALYRAGVSVTLGKGRRSAAVAQACRECGGLYLAAVGGAAALLASHVRAAKLVAWPDLGPEALYQLELDNLPAIVAIDTKGGNIYD